MVRISFLLADREPFTVDLPPGVYTVGSGDQDTVVVDLPEFQPGALQLRITDALQLFVMQGTASQSLSVNGQAVIESFAKPGDLIRLGSLILSVELVTQEEQGGQGQILEASFLTQVGAAVRFPFRGDSMIMVVVLVLIGGAVNFLPGVFRWAGMFVRVAIGIFIALLFRDIVLATINGEDEMPKEPEVSLDWAQLRETLIPMYAIFLFPMLPMTFARMGLPDGPAWVVPVLGVAGACYIPMALLLYLVTDEIWAAHPGNVVLSLFRAPWGYLAVLLALVPVVGLFFWMDLSSEMNRRENRFLTVGINTVLQLVEVYLAFVIARVLGLYYRHFRHRLRWDD